MREIAGETGVAQGHTIRYEDTQSPSTEALGLSIQQVDALRARQQAEVQEHNPQVETVAPTLGGAEPTDEEVARAFYTSVLHTESETSEYPSITLPDGTVVPLTSDERTKEVLKELGIDPAAIPPEGWEGDTYHGFLWPPQLKRTDPDFEAKRLTYQTDQEVASDEPFPWAKNTKGNGQGGLAGLVALAKQKLGLGGKPQAEPVQPDVSMNTVRNTGE